MVSFVINAAVPDDRLQSNRLLGGKYQDFVEERRVVGAASVTSRQLRERLR